MVFTTAAPPNFPLMNNQTKKMAGKVFLEATWEPTN